MIAIQVVHVHQPMERNDCQEIIDELIIQIPLGYFLEILYRLCFTLRCVGRHERNEYSNRKNDEKGIICIYGSKACVSMGINEAEHGDPAVEIA